MLKNCLKILSFSALGILFLSTTATAFDVTVARTSAWDGGFVGELRVENTSGAAVSGWQLQFHSAAGLDSIWNAVVVSEVNGTHTLDNESWNGDIAIGGTVIVGFSGSGDLNGSTISTCSMNSTPCVLSFVDEVGGGGGGGGGGAGGGSTDIGISELDTDGVALEMTVPLGTEMVYTLEASGAANSSFSVATNNPDRVRVEVDGQQLRVTGLAPGRAGVRLDEAAGGRRIIGAKVLEAGGSNPGLPPYLAIGSVSEDSETDLEFWRDMNTAEQGKRMDFRYIYLNGGPFLGWHTWSNEPGGRARRFIRESKKLGMIPIFVFYNIPDGGESYETDLAHIQDPEYLAAYFGNLALALSIINEESPNDPVGLLFEPDFLGYMAQNSGLAPDQIHAKVHTAYDQGLLVAGVDPAFDNSVAGLVQAINYLVHRETPNAWFGWQMNLWASPAGGFTTPIPGNGLIHKTDTEGIGAGRGLIYQEAVAITQYYLDAGIASWGADFVSIDKYGLDAGAEPGAASHPEGSIWFWNNDHWNNYLVFTRAMADTTDLPVVLWQIPVGHIEDTQALNPYSGDGSFAPLNNTTARYEDSAGTFFLGDTFETTGARFDFFAGNQGGDPAVVVDGSRITWQPHFEAVRDAGIIAVLFGAGVGISTDGVGSPPTDDYWWISRVQRYFEDPLPLVETPLFTDGFESGSTGAWSSTVP